jgi:ketosteroid isomerase-like protein
MSQQNIDIAHRLFDAFNRAFAGAPSDLLELTDPQIEWVPMSAHLGGEDASYFGRGGVRQWLDDMKRDWTSIEMRPENFGDLGDDGAMVQGTWHALGRGGRTPLDFPHAAWLLRVRDGKLVLLRTFLDREEALEAAGLPEMPSLSAVTQPMDATGLQRGEAERCESPRFVTRRSGRYWARTSDLQLVELALSQLS